MDKDLLPQLSTLEILKLEALKLSHRHGLTPAKIVENAKEYVKYLLDDSELKEFSRGSAGATSKSRKKQ